MSDADRPGPDSAEDRLRAAWIRFVSPDDALFERLVARHRERHRRYHRLEHVDHVVRHCLSLARTEALHGAALAVTVAAAVYHDAVYEPRSPANERASARLAQRDLASLGWVDDRIARVVAMIEGTTRHLDPPDQASAVLYDADLAVLGSSPTDYETYRGAVREEYRHVDDHGWAAGRAELLEAFLERPAIYATATARDRWEAQARANLAHEIESLRN